MANTQSFDLSNLDIMMGLVESIFSELNIEKYAFLQAPSYRMSENLF